MGVREGDIGSRTLLGDGLLKLDTIGMSYQGCPILANIVFRDGRRYRNDQRE
jgi:hypothetical protein